MRRNVSSLRKAVILDRKIKKYEGMENIFNEDAGGRPENEQDAGGENKQKDHNQPKEEGT